MFRFGRLSVIPLLAVIAVLAMAARVWTRAGSGATRATPAPPKQLSAAAWRALIGKAKAEGSVTIYTVGAPANYTNLAKRFKELYGIDVIVNRKVDNDLLVQINAEESTGKAIADVWVAATKGIVLGALGNGWVVDAVGPNFFNKRFDRSKLLIGKAGSPARPCSGWRGTRSASHRASRTSRTSEPRLQGQARNVRSAHLRPPRSTGTCGCRRHTATTSCETRSAEAEDLRVVADGGTGGRIR